jgi:hypothetical protein
MVLGFELRSSYEGSFWVSGKQTAQGDKKENSMEGVAETKFGAKTKGWTIERLLQPGIHPIISHLEETS